MKPTPFEYSRPETLGEACALLAADEDARPLAGGQTLIPMLAMRLARPTRLVDLAGIDALTGIACGDGAVAIGAMTRQAAVERSALIVEQVPLLARVMPWVGHAPTRHRGTIGGTVANADPSAEVPLVLATLNGNIVLRAGDAERSAKPAVFFDGPMMTTAEQGEVITQIQLPVWREGRIGVGFHEVANRSGDFAIVAAAAQLALDADGKCMACAVGVGGVEMTPKRLDDVSAALVGTTLSTSVIEEIAHVATKRLDAMRDPHITPEYRRRVAALLVAKVLADARDDAGRGTP